MQIDIPEQFQILATSQKRIIIFYGGRGGGKTVNIAIVLLLKSLEKRLRIFCCREILESIDQSVHTTLVKKIRDLNLVDEFDIQRNKITAKRTGSEFFYGGLFRNIEGRKGLEDVNFVWISEGAVISEESLQILLPSIRANNSQVIIDMNPRYESDAIYKRYIANPDPELCDLVNINYTENPYFPAVLEQQRLADKKILPPDEYTHI
jgi:phage terminase large subunit